MPSESQYARLKYYNIFGSTSSCYYNNDNAQRNDKKEKTTIATVIIYSKQCKRRRRVVHKTYYLITQCFTFFFLSSATAIYTSTRRPATHDRECKIIARLISVFSDDPTRSDIWRIVRPRLANDLSEWADEKNCHSRTYI